tara:strand:- start:639 stop:1754 length:1116 start_codon:yes stop_codon:yes gene_type:complete
MHINLNNLTGIKKSFFNYETGNLFRLVSKNSYPRLGSDFKFIDQDDESKPFEPYYKKNILPHVEVFELKRIESLKNLRKRNIIAIPLQVIIIILTIAGISALPFGDATQICLALGIMAFGGAAFWSHKPVRQYAANVKKEVFPEIFKFFGKDYIYSEESVIEMPALKPSGIIPSYDRSYLEDYVKGKYKDITLELTEAKLTETTGSGKHRRTVIKFNGIFVLLEMNKNFSGKTVVKKDQGKMGNWFARKFNKPLFSKETADLKNVKLEDPIFEKKFEVYSTDQVEARYLLTTSFMERLLELSSLFSKNGVIQCSFYLNKLLLMIPSDKNRFEVGSIYQPATFVDDINHILKEMAVIFKIIDILKLERKTGL